MYICIDASLGGQGELIHNCSGSDIWQGNAAIVVDASVERYAMLIKMIKVCNS